MKILKEVVTSFKYICVHLSKMFVPTSGEKIRVLPMRK